MLTPHSPAPTRTWHTVHCGFCRAPYVIVTVPAPMRMSSGAEEKATCPACETTNVVNVPGQVEQSVFAATLGLQRDQLGVHASLRLRVS